MYIQPCTCILLSECTQFYACMQPFQCICIHVHFLNVRPYALMHVYCCVYICMYMVMYMYAVMCICIVMCYMHLSSHVSMYCHVHVCSHAYVHSGIHTQYCVCTVICHAMNAW